MIIVDIHSWSDRQRVLQYLRYPWISLPSYSDTSLDVPMANQPRRAYARVGLHIRSTIWGATHAQNVQKAIKRYF